MKIFVIDASVVIASLTDENKKIKSYFGRLLKEARATKVKIFSLTLLPLEVANVLRYKGLINEKRDEAFKIFRQLPIIYQNLELDEISVVMKQSGETDTSVYDCAYHYLARERGGTFLTCDNKYFQKAKKLGGIEFLG